MFGYQNGGGLSFLYFTKYIRLLVFNIDFRLVLFINVHLLSFRTSFVGKKGKKTLFKLQTW